MTPNTKDLQQRLRDEAERLASLGPGVTAAMRVMFDAADALAKLETERINLRAAIGAALAAQPKGTVPMPTNEDEAAGMALVGEAWLRANAPHRLKHAQAPAPVAASTTLSDADIKRIHDNNAFLPDMAGLVDLWPGILAFGRAVAAAVRSPAVGDDGDDDDETDRQLEEAWSENEALKEELAELRAAPPVRRQDVEMAAALMDEAAALLEAIEPETLEKLPGFRWPLADELGGAAGILRDALGESKPPVHGTGDANG